MAACEVTVLIDSAIDLSSQLTKLIKKVASVTNADDFNIQLLKLLSCDPQTSSAALSALNFNLEATKGYWLHATPVELYVDMSKAYSLGHTHLQLSSAEITELVTTLNDFLKQDGLVFHAVTNTDWYLQLPTRPQIQTTPLNQIEQKEISQHFPSGTDANYWIKLLTEIQMLLKTHPVNLARAKLGKPLINSLWFWGEGNIIPLPESVKWNKVLSNSNVVKTLAKMLGVDGLDFSLETISKIASGSHLIVIEKNTVAIQSSALCQNYQPSLNLETVFKALKRLSRKYPLNIYYQAKLYRFEKKNIFLTAWKR